MPRTWAPKMVLNKKQADGTLLRMYLNKDHIKQFVQKLEEVYTKRSGLDPAFVQHAIETFKEFLDDSYDWELPILKLPRKKNGKFQLFKTIPLFKAEVFEDKKGSKVVFPEIRLWAFGEDQVMVDIAWYSGNTVVDMKGFLKLTDFCPIESFFEDSL